VTPSLRQLDDAGCSTVVAKSDVQPASKRLRERRDRSYLLQNEPTSGLSLSPFPFKRKLMYRPMWATKFAASFAHSPSGISTSQLPVGLCRAYRLHGHRVPHIKNASTPGEMPSSRA